MARDDTVAFDYGLSDKPAVNGDRERRIWETIHVSPDPFAAGYLYVVQKLAGEWKYIAPIAEEKDGRIMVHHLGGITWISRESDEAPVTRVIYCRMDDSGRLINVHASGNGGA